MSTADDDMETNATLRICFRTRYRRNSASEFDERVRSEMMKISDDETLAVCAICAPNSSRLTPGHASRACGSASTSCAVLR